MFLPSIGEYPQQVLLREQTFLPSPMLQNTCLLSALPNRLELDLFPQKVFYKGIIVISHLPTGIFDTLCLSCSNIRAKKSTVYRSESPEGCLSAPPERLSKSVSNQIQITGDHCPVMLVQFYVITLFLMLDIQIQTLWTNATNLQIQAITEKIIVTYIIYECLLSLLLEGIVYFSPPTWYYISASFPITENYLAQRQRPVETVCRKRGQEAVSGSTLKQTPVSMTLELSEWR